MRSALILLTVLLFAVPASPQTSSDHNSIANKEQKSAQETSATNPKPTSVNKAKPVAIQNTGNKRDAPADEKLQIDRRLAEYTGKLSTYTENLARYTFWLVIVTAVLAGIGVWQGCQLKRSIDLARDEFISTHRPKIIIRAIYRDDAPDNETEPMPQMTFSIANIGSTPATVFEISATVREIDWDLCPRPAYATSTKYNTVIHIGNPLPLTIHIGDDVAGKQNFELGFWIGNKAFEVSRTSICCFGFILYKDSLDHIYRTAFLRRYNPSPDRWDKIDDPDYEYQD